MFIGFTIGYGLLAGGHLEADNGPLSELPARFFHAIGYSAEEVRITGLERHRPEQVLAAIGVKLGGSLIGFDAARARRMMENIDWVESARIHRIYPNELDIVVRERRPFAIWQRDGAYYVIDKSGAAISTLEPGQVGNLLLVTGEGAQTQVASLVNHPDENRLVTSKVKAASRVGGRRWNLYLTTGQRVLLPETNRGRRDRPVREARAAIRHTVTAWSEIDLRLKGRVVFVPEALPGAESVRLRRRWSGAGGSQSRRPALRTGSAR